MQQSTEATVVRTLDLRLLEAGTRASPEQLGELLADEVVEFGSSGLSWNKAQIVAGLLAERAGVECRADGMRVKLLAEGVALVTYRATRRHPDDATEVRSLRSSVWKHDGRRWRMIFHQGTRAGSLAPPLRGGDGV